jgi:hypothetical protein
MRVMVWIIVAILSIWILRGMINWKYFDIVNERAWREQARVQLQGAKYSINRLVDKWVQTQEAVDIVMRQARNGWPTGDGHAYYLTYWQSLDTSLWFDASSDCKPWDTVYKLTDVLQFFKDPASAEKAFKEILLWVDSTDKTLTTWNFDWQPERLEYIKLPDTSSTQKDQAYMLVLGTQSDEVNLKYATYKDMIFYRFLYTTIFEILAMGIMFKLLNRNYKKCLAKSE